MIMKETRLHLMALTVALTSVLISCDNDMIWDIAPIKIFITVSDAEGQDLLNPDTPNSIDYREVTAEWRGETYVGDTISLFTQQPLTRFLMGHMHGLVYLTEHGKSKLCFGELTGHDTYVDEPLTLHWPDGSTDVITIRASAVEGYRSLKLNRKFKLNGKVFAKDTSSPEINIVK